MVYTYFNKNNYTFKNIMCNNYDTECSYGSKCNYAHSENELEAFKTYLRKYSNYETDYAE